MHDQWGNIIAELDATGATVREYIWLVGAEIAPTRGSRTTVDRPIAVIDAVNTASPVTLYVHVDHLNRPVRLTDSTKAAVWDVIYTPWGAPHTITGAQTLNARFPGQWFQLEAGLHYNWHRHYDPSLGRYTQPDPLGFVDGPSVYAYARSTPAQLSDTEGLQSRWPDKIPDQIDPTLRPFICVQLREAVRFYCKSFPYSLFQNNACSKQDICTVLEEKWKKRRSCIKYQALLSSYCFGTNITHPQRYEDESEAINKCREYFSEKGCGCLPN